MRQGAGVEVADGLSLVDPTSAVATPQIRLLLYAEVKKGGFCDLTSCPDQLALGRTLRVRHLYLPMLPPWVVINPLCKVAKGLAPNITGDVRNGRGSGCEYDDLNIVYD